jgi:hypothetical protein
MQSLLPHKAQRGKGTVGGPSAQTLMLWQATHCRTKEPLNSASTNPTPFCILSWGMSNMQPSLSSQTLLKRLDAAAQCSGHRNDYRYFHDDRLTGIPFIKTGFR